MPAMAGSFTSATSPLTMPVVTGMKRARRGPGVRRRRAIEDEDAFFAGPSHQRADRDQHGLFPAGELDLGPHEHAGLEHVIGIGDLDLDAGLPGALLEQRRDPPNGPVEDPARVGVGGHHGLLPDSHLGVIPLDHENHRGERVVLEDGHDRLIDRDQRAFVHEALADHAVRIAVLPEGPDLRIGELQFRGLEGGFPLDNLGLGDFELRLAGVVRGHGGIQLRGRGDLFLAKRHDAVVLALGQFQIGDAAFGVGLGDLKLRRRLLGLPPELLIVQYGDHIIAADAVADVHEQLLDPARRLGRDHELRLGYQRAREHGDVPDHSFANRLSLHGDRRIRTAGFFVSAEAAMRRCACQIAAANTARTRTPRITFFIVISQNLYESYIVQTSRSAGAVHRPASRPCLSSYQNPGRRLLGTLENRPCLHNTLRIAEPKRLFLGLFGLFCGLRVLGLRWAERVARPSR